MLENQELLEIGILISKGDKSVEKEIKKSKFKNFFQKIKDNFK